MNTRHYRVITFDLDDTLWELAPVIQRADRLCWEWLATHYPRIAQHATREGLMAQRMALLQEDAWQHRISAVRTEIMARSLCESGYTPTQAHSAAREAFEIFLSARHEVTFFERAIDALVTLARDYRLGVLTNGNACVHRLGIGHLFDFVFSAESVQASKPDPLMFRRAIEAGGCEPARIIHVGDHAGYDIAPAQALGMRTVWMNTARHPWPGGPPPDAQVHSAHELLLAIETLERDARA